MALFFHKSKNRPSAGRASNLQLGSFSKASIGSLVGWSVAAVACVWSNSALAVFLFWASSFLFVGFFHADRLSDSFTGLLNGLLIFFSVPIKWVKTLSTHLLGVDAHGEQATSSGKRIRYASRLCLGPAGIFIFFFVLYLIASPDFRHATAKALDQMGQVFRLGIAEINPARIGVWILGLLACSTVLFRPILNTIASWEDHRSPKLKRNRKRSNLIWRLRKSSLTFLDLKDEFRKGMLSIVSLNLLLGVVLVLEFRSHTGLAAHTRTAQELSEFVHQGTYILILSILLAMGILAFTFRANLNFYPKTKRLRIAASVWIGLNSLLALSVVARNVEYIQAYGLAFKRVGVMIFLWLTFIGLCTVAIKVWKSKSIFFLLRSNGWSLYVTLLMASFVNWSLFITQYNLTAQTGKVDLDFLVHDMSAQNTPLLLAVPDLFEKEPGLAFALERKQRRYLTKLESRSWPSWNRIDAQFSSRTNPKREAISYVK